MQYLLVNFTRRNKTALDPKAVLFHLAKFLLEALLIWQLAIGHTIFEEVISIFDSTSFCVQLLHFKWEVVAAFWLGHYEAVIAGYWLIILHM